MSLSTLERVIVSNAQCLRDVYQWHQIHKGYESLRKIRHTKIERTGLNNRTQAVVQSTVDSHYRDNKVNSKSQWPDRLHTLVIVAHRRLPDCLWSTIESHSFCFNLKVVEDGKEIGDGPGMQCYLGVFVPLRTLKQCFDLSNCSSLLNLTGKEYIDSIITSSLKQVFVVLTIRRSARI